MLKADISCLYEMWSRDARELVQYAKLMQSCFLSTSFWLHRLSCRRLLFGFACC